MIDWLIGLPVSLGLALSALAAIAFGTPAYLLGWSLVRRDPTNDVMLLGGNLLRVSGTLLALLLSLTFAEVRSELGTLRDSVEQESEHLEDVHHDLARFGGAAAERLRDLVIAYASSVVRDEWPALARGVADERTSELFDRLEAGVIELEPATEEQETLHERMLVDFDQITDLRIDRHFHAVVAPPAFLYIAALGFLCTMGMLGVHAPTVRSLALIFFYCAFIGVVVYFILSLSHPFEGIARIGPEPFQTLYRGSAGAPK
ncbi:MAG: DUF4239 domain-containing protein [Myxococcota bacterium]|nr:DUF4239 domain-containing protein [Myxococcota bacterium]